MADAAQRWSSASSRQIIGSPYDSDSDVSFAQPYCDKKCKVRKQTLIDRISNNAADLHHYGRRLALQYKNAIQTFVESDTEEDSDGAHRRQSRHAQREALNRILDHAGNCAASLRTVADTALDELPGACLGGTSRNDGDASGSRDEQPSHRARRIKFSEAKPHDGTVLEDVSVTTDAYSSAYSSPDYTSSGSSAMDNSSSSYESSSVSSNNSSVRRVVRGERKVKRRRRNQFIRRRAIERHATETEDEAEEVTSLHFGGPRLPKASSDPWSYPSQELRHEVSEQSLEKRIGSKMLNTITEDDPTEKKMAVADGVDREYDATAPDLVNTSNEDSLLDTTNEEEMPFSTRSYHRIISQNYKESQRQLKWKSMMTVVQHSCLVDVSLVSSHLGPVISGIQQLDDAAGLQLGDIIIRLDTEDISHLDALSATGVIDRMTGDSICASFLRKNMSF